MSPVIVIAKNTFREIIRDRILYGLLVFAILLMGLSFALGQLSFTEQARISTNFGFAAMNISAIIISIFVGATLVTKEIDSRTVYTVLARPVSRQQFLVGKIFGLSMVTLVALAGLSLILATVLQFIGQPWDRDCTFVVIGFFWESMVVLSFTLLFGAFTKPMLAVTYAIGFFLVARSVESLNYLAEKSADPTFQTFNKILRRSIPNLSHFNWSNYALVPEQLPAQQVAAASVYAFGWIGVCLVITSIILRKRDFT